MLKKRSKGKFLYAAIVLGLLIGCLNVSAQESTPEIDLNVEENDIETYSEESNQQIPESLPVYTWDDFNTGKDCRMIIKEIAVLPQFNELYQNIRTYCLSEKVSAWQELLRSFRQSKQELMVQQTMNTSSNLKYLKVIPYLFFDIQDKNASGDQWNALLDQAEDAIINHHPDSALSLIKQLPEVFQDKFKNAQFLLKRLIQIREQLDDYAQQREVTND